jgi:epoxyqueuosine reductase
VRHGLDRADLPTLWSWTETQFLDRTEGSAIRRIGFERWQRNLAVAMGNALRAGPQPVIEAALRAALPAATALVGEHIRWALAQGDRG